MPDTAFAWGPSFVANGITAGQQTDPDIALLASGNILISWTTDDNTPPAHPGGDNVVGRRFNQIGEVVRDIGYPEAQVNLDDFGTNHSGGAIAALPGDGFLVVAEQVSSGGDYAFLKLMEYFRDGREAAPDSATLQLDGSATFPNYRDLDVAVADAESTFVAYRKIGVDDATDSDIIGKFYNTVTNRYTGPVEIFDPGSTPVLAPQVAALNNGNFVIVARHDVSGSSEGLLKIIDPASVIIKDVTLLVDSLGGSGADTGFRVTPLNSGFAVVWQRSQGADSEIRVQRFTDAGAVSGATIRIGTAADDAFDSPALAPHPDGGFFVLWRDASTTTLHLQRFDAAGTPQGTEVSLDALGARVPVLQSYGDGRVAAAWEQGDDIKMQIFDTRDAPTLGRFSPENWHLGTWGDDAILASVDVTPTKVYGLVGNDTITATGGPKDYFGGSGDDLITAFNDLGPNTTTRLDTYNGGDGDDTMDWSRLSSGGNVFDMALGRAWRASNPLDFHDMGEFENLVGSDHAETINGTLSANLIEAGNGGDWISPGGGDDTVDGGAGRDMLSFFDLADAPGRTNVQYRLDIDMGAGTATNQDASERIQFSAIERLTGTVFADRIKGDAGDNELRGLGDYDWFIATEGNDTIDGGTGQDMLSFLDYQSTATNVVADIFSSNGLPPTGTQASGLVVDLANPGNNTGLAAGLDLTSIERITGSGRQDVFFGDSGQNDFRGLGDYDWFVSSEGGRERYFGGDGIDTVTYYNAAAGVVANLSNGARVNGQETGYGSGGVAARDLYFEIENLVGSRFNDELRGSSGRNQLNGLEGDDFIFGYAGVDYLMGGLGNDTIDGGGGSDYALFSGNQADYTLTRAGNEVTAVGSDGTDRLIDVEYFRFDDVTVDIWTL